MDPENQFPETLLEAIEYFADPDHAHDFTVGLRWPKGSSKGVGPGAAKGAKKSR